jgi:hypothetical protein
LLILPVLCSKINLCKASFKPSKNFLELINILFNICLVKSSFASRKSMSYLKNIAAHMASFSYLEGNFHRLPLPLPPSCLNLSLWCIPETIVQ